MARPVARPPARGDALRVGIVGCGTVTYHCHLPALASNSACRVVALADDDPEAIARCRQRAPQSDVVTWPAMLTRDDIDVVLVATPTATHAALALEVLATPKHLYLEKPIGISTQESTQLMRASAERDERQPAATAVVGFNRRHHPIFRRAKAVLEQGELGAIHTVQAVFAEPVNVAAMPAWKRSRSTGGGALLDLASHHIDLVRWLLQSDVDEVVASIDSRASQHDEAVITLSMRVGVRVQLIISLRAAPTDTVEIHGERGVLRMDRHRQHVMLTTPRTVGYGTRSRSLPVLDQLTAQWRFALARRLRPGADPSYAEAWRAMVDRIAGRPSASARLHDGAASLAVVLAAEAASSSGEAVVPIGV